MLTLSLLLLLAGCTSADASAPLVQTVSAPAASARANPAPPWGTHLVSVASAEPSSLPIYAWGPSAAADRLDRRFAEPPSGFRRVKVSPGSFGEFLRSLPLQPKGSPVVDYRGNKLYDAGNHANIAAVVDIDIGSADLQQCADAVLRLHAEWGYGRGERDLSYRAASKQPLSYHAYLAGDRAFPAGNKLLIRRAAAAKRDDHEVFRAWLNEVFAWTNTAAIERDTEKVSSLAHSEPGDFFVMTGSPFGHAVILLDIARDRLGRTALLIGQSFMPAQSFQVLRPSGGDSSWFIAEAGDDAVDTPFWKPFPLSSLRRFAPNAAERATTALPR